MSGKPLADAMIAPRLHHQWQPDQVHLDREPPDAHWRALLAELQRTGHAVSRERRGASIQAILFQADGTFVGACDPKKGGMPAAP
jgi:gamma-glutamyltranspeptidase/glutathione hydrolase